MSCSREPTYFDGLERHFAELRSNTHTRGFCGDLFDGICVKRVPELRGEWIVGVVFVPLVIYP